MDRGAWKATVHGITESQTPLSDQTTVSIATTTRREGGRHRDSLGGERIPSRGNNRCRGPEVGMCLVFKEPKKTVSRKEEAARG